MLHPLLRSGLNFPATVQVVFLLYCVSSSTRGSSLLYRAWLHPALQLHEAEIDIAMERLRQRGQ